MADGEDGAVRAFEDLRAEVSLMRRAVERLMAERTEPSDTPDYAETLGIISRNLSATAQRIDAVVDSPALALTPDKFGRQIIAAGYEARPPVELAVARADGSAHVAHADVEKGQRLMRAESPRTFADIVACNRLITANHETLVACRKRAGRVNQPVHCVIMVKPEG